jgi:hypothetical protein
MKIISCAALILSAIVTLAQTQEAKRLQLPPEAFKRQPFSEPEWIACPNPNDIRHLRIWEGVQAVKVRKHGPVTLSKEELARVPDDGLRIALKVDDKGHPYCFGLPKEDTAEKMKLTPEQRSALLNDVAAQLKDWEYQITYLNQQPVFVESWVVLVRDKDQLVAKRDKK